MDIESAKALLETLVFAVEQAVQLQDTNVLLLVIEFFKAVIEQGRELTLAVLEHLLAFFHR